MKIFKALSVVLVVLVSSANAEEALEHQWVSEQFDEDEVHVSVNGEITEGDRLKIRLVKGNCELGNLSTTFITYSDNPRLFDLADQYVHAHFMGEKVKARILFTIPFFNAQMAWVDLNWLPLDVLKSILSKNDPITMELLDTEDFRSSDYFDILENSWSNTGLVSALDEGLKICQEMY
jgi:hypothetical protein